MIINQLIFDYYRAALDATAPVFGTLPTRDPKTGLCSKMDRLCLSTFSNTGMLQEIGKFGICVVYH